MIAPPEDLAPGGGSLFSLSELEGAALRAPGSPPPALKLASYTPKGDGARARKIRLRFSAPLCTPAQLRTQDDLPDIASLRPAIPGRWRRRARDTIEFEPKAGELPLATRYTVKLKRGLRSAQGAAYEGPRKLSFSTARPEFRLLTPQGEPLSRRPILLLSCNQAFDPRAICAALQLTGTKAKLRLATEAELALAPDARPGPQLACLSLTDPLPGDTRIELSLPAGFVGREGKLGTAEAFHAALITHGAFSVRALRCERPQDPLEIEFTTPLSEAQQLSPAALRIDRIGLLGAPLGRAPVRALRVEGRSLFVDFEGEDFARYEISLPATLEDRFGQRLPSCGPHPLRLGKREPTLTQPPEALIIQDAAEPAVLPIRSHGYERLLLQVWRVPLKRWRQLDPDIRAHCARPPDLRRLIEIDRPTRERQLDLELRELFPEGSGHLIFSLSAIGDADEAPRRWLQRSRLSIEAACTAEAVYARVSWLKSGAPVPGARVELSGLRRSRTKTDNRACAVLQFPEAGPRYLLVRHEGEQAFLPLPERPTEPPRLRALVFTDRAHYRPGETARVRGWLLRWAPGEGLKPPESAKIGYTLKSPRRERWSQGGLQIDDRGGFSLSLPIPQQAPLGAATLHIDLYEGYTHSLRIATERRPELTLSLTAGPGPFVLPEPLTLTAEARAYTGAALQGAAIHWSVRATQVDIRPPGHPSLSFGRAGAYGDRVDHKQLQGRTDSSGRHRLQIEANPELCKPSCEGPHSATEPQLRSATCPPDRALRFYIEAFAEGPNRQRCYEERRLLVYPAALLIGLRCPAQLPLGHSLQVEWLVTRHDGRPVADQPVQIWLIPWGAGAPEQRSCRSEAQLSQVSFQPKRAGRYRLIAALEDAEGRSSHSELSVEVFRQEGLGARQALKLRLIPDKPVYAPEDLAELTLLPSLPGAACHWSLSQGSRILTQGSFQLPGLGPQRLRLRLGAEMIPGVQLHVQRCGQVDGRPASSSASLTLPISAEGQRLQVAIDAPEALEPGAQAQLSLQLTDAEGAGVAADCAVLIVDEAACPAAELPLPDPIDALYKPVDARIARASSRDRLILDGQLPAPPAPPREEPVILADIVRRAPDPGPPQLKLRRQLDAVAFYEPKLRCDEDGKAQLGFRLPDNLTRYRVMVVAMSERAKGGSAERAIVASKALMLRPSPPRFVNTLDRFTLPITVENNSDEDLDVQVSLQASNARVFGKSSQAKIAGRSQQVVSFEVDSEGPGALVLRAGATAGALSDAVELRLPARADAGQEELSLDGSLHASACAHALPLSSAKPGFGALRLSLSTSALAELSEAFAYLRSYPHRCSEQLASRLLSGAALGPLQAAFSDDWDPQAAAKQQRADIEALIRRQAPSGGWGYWEDTEVNPLASVHVTHALLRAQAAGAELPEDALPRALYFIKRLGDILPARKYTAATKHQLQAYGVFVRALAGQPSFTQARRLLSAFERPEDAPLTLLLWLQPALAAGGRTILPRLEEAMVVEAESARLRPEPLEHRHLVLHTPLRSSALALLALLSEAPEDPRAAQLARGLFDARRKGRWSSTHDTAWALLALSEYFKQREAEAPALSARAWLGEQLILEERLSSRRDTRARSIPMDTLQASGADTLRLQAEGAGRLYYKLSLNYLPADLRSQKLSAQDHGFSVTRSYEGLDKPQDVSRDRSGTWRIRAGARVRVRLRMKPQRERHHVALVDPLPAGLEPEPTLPPPEPAFDGWPRRSRGPYPGGRWFGHQELREDRGQAFTEEIQAGSYEYSYITRAITCGRFTAPPARAEEMYEPDVFGRSESDVVVVNEL